VSSLYVLSEKLAKESKKFFRIILFLKFIIFILGVYLIYTLLVLLGFGLEPLAVMLTFIRILKTFILLTTIYFIAFLLYVQFPAADFSKFFLSILIAYLLSFFNINVSPESLNDPSFLLHIIIQSRIELMRATVTVLILFATLMILGFSRTLKYEKLLNACLLILFSYILGVLFSPYVTPELTCYSLLSLTSLPSFLHNLFTDRTALFIIYFFMYVEIAAHLSYAAHQLNTIANRHSRIARQLGMISVQAKEKERIKGLRVSKRFMEILSPLATIILRDAYEGYAFLGEGTSLYMSSKILSYLEEFAKKSPDEVNRITGRELFSSTLRYLLLILLPSLIIRLFFGVVMVIGSFLLAIYVLTNIAQGYIYETTLVQSFLYATLAFASFIYVLTTAISHTFQKRK